MHIYVHDALLFLFILSVDAKSRLGEPELEVRKSANSTQVIPSPLVLPPSQYWDGDNGQWSSFALRVGSPAQDARVLVSTNSPETLVVLPLGCTSAAINPVPDDCANSRGGLFSSNTSSTWVDQGTFGINQDGVGFEANLGYSQHAEYGLETLGLGFLAGGASGPTLNNQTVAGIATTSPFYLGILGLSTQPVNYSTIGNFSAPSFLTSLRSQLIIPSLSWSFTAGAKYRLKAGQYAQLIFGGYDSSRFTRNSLSFTLSEDIDRDIVVAIQSITYSGISQSSLLSNPTTAFIESTDANIWLPESACQAFEQAFGIYIDNSTGLYLINATQYTYLQASNPQVTFTLSNSLSGGETVNIVLPFNAFGLSASFPFTLNNTYYFPLKKSTNDSQNTLGRAFLQEAYLIVDYERNNFSISQCVFQDGTAEQISAILSPTYSTSANSTSSTPSNSSSGSKSMSPGIIAGAIIGGLAVLLIAGGVGCYVSGRRNRSASTSPTEDTALTHLQPGSMKDSLRSSFHQEQDLDSLYLPLKKLNSSGSVYRSADINQPDGELGTQGEIFQLATHTDRLEYVEAVNRIASERRAEVTPQIDGRGVAFELYGSEPIPVEIDDEQSRRGAVLSLMSSGRLVPLPMSRESSRASTSGPTSDTL